MSGKSSPDSSPLGRKHDQISHNSLGCVPVYEEKPPSDVDQGWAFVVLLASFVCLFVVATIVYATGVLHMALLEKFRSDAAFTSLLGSVFFSLLSLTGPVVGFVVNRWSCRVGTILGGILVFIGFTCSFFVTKDLPILLLTYSVIAGCGLGFVTLTPIIAVGYSFEKYRGVAVGFTVMGAGFGIFGNGPFCQYLLDTFGLNGTFLLLGAVGLQCVLAGSLLRPSQLELKQKLNLRRAELTKHNEPTESSKCKMYSALFHNKTYVMIVIGGFLWNAAYSIISVNLSNYAYMLGTTKQDAAFLWTLVGVGSTVNRFLAGLTLGPNGIDPLLLQFGFLAIIGVLVPSLPFYADLFSGQCIFALLYGIYSGGLVVLTNPLCLELVGLQQLPQAVGFFYFVAGFGCIFGPPITGLIVDATSNHSLAFYLAGGLYLLAAMFALVSTLWRKENKFIPAASILSLNDTRFLSGSAFISGSVTLIFDSKNALHVDRDSLYSHQSATCGPVDSNNVAKILLSKKSQGRARTQSENDAHSVNTFSSSPFVFKKRTSSVQMDDTKLKDQLLMVENGINQRL